MRLVLGLVLALWGAGTQALTADQLWARWQGNLAALGVTLEAEGTAQVSGGLDLTGVTLRATAPMKAAAGAFRLDRMTLRDQNDAVVVTPGAELRLTLSPEVSDLALLVTQAGLVVTVSDRTGGVAYDFAATSVALGGTATFDAGYAADVGVEPPRGTMTGRITATGISGSWTDATAALRDMGLHLALTAMTYDGRKDDPKLRLGGQFSGTKSDLRYDLHLALPLDAGFAALMDGATPAAVAQRLTAALKAGLSVDLQASGGAERQQTSTGMRGQVVDTDLDSKAAISSLGFDRAGFHLASQIQGMTLRLHAPNLPVPQIAGSFGRAVFAISGPLIGDVAQPFGLRLALDGLVADAAIWDKRDPAQRLPRDPMSVNIDLSGRAHVDLLGMMAADQGGMTEVAKPRIDRVDVAALAFRGLGVALAGSGAFAFDNTGDVPVPVGKAEMTLNGFGGLLDDLVALGVIKAAQATQARLVLALGFDGTGDTLVSRVVTGADGSVTVNGQRMR